MLDRLIKALYASYHPTDVKGIFVSLYSASWECLWSQGTLEPMKSLDVSLPLLYNAIAPQQNPASAIIDVVESVVEYTDANSFIWLDMTTHGVCILSGVTSGVSLPATQGISSSKDALEAIKKKYAITGNVRFFSFTTKRMIV